jgi:hypothetical protein
VSPNKASFNLRENGPLPRNILHTRGVVAYRFTGQRPNPDLLSPKKGYRSWLSIRISLKDTTGHPIYPVVGRDSAKSGLG